MNTITEIQTALDELDAAMVEKGVVSPNTQLHVRSNASFVIHLGCAYEIRSLDGNDYKVLFGDTPAEAIEKARAYIAALPSPEEAVTREYLGKVASAIDYATKHSIEDKYVTPLRGVKMAMTDNLLTKEPNT